MRRSWLKGLIDVTKRYLVATAAHNLGRMPWKLLGVGKPRGLQGCGGRSWILAEWAYTCWSVLPLLRRNISPNNTAIAKAVLTA